MSVASLDAKREREAHLLGEGNAFLMQLNMLLKKKLRCEMIGIRYRKRNTYKIQRAAALESTHMGCE